MSTLTYHPLEKESIRLLRVYPDDDFDADIICDIRHINLQDKPSYAALSYTWGPPAYDRAILVNNFYFEITSNLDFALRTFRKTKWQMIWVDQICINQQDINERSEQVSLMWQIYSKALCVFISLGPGVGDESRAVRLMQQADYWMQQPHDHSTSAGSIYLSDDPAAWIAFGTLLLSPWFTRSWTVQEACATKATRIMCAGGLASLEAFLMVKKRWMVLSQRKPELRNNKENQKNFQGGWKALGGISSLTMMTRHEKPSNLFHIVSTMRERLATDPRDKIYAFIGLASNSTSFEKPDYAKTIEKVYIEFALSVITKYPGLVPQLLMEAGRDQQSLSLPSWVPDWSFTENYHHLGYPVVFEGDGVKIQVDYDLHNDRVSTAVPECEIGPPTLNIPGWEQGSISVVGPTLQLGPSAMETSTYEAKVWILHTLEALRRHLPELAHLLDPAMLLGSATYPLPAQTEIFHRFAKAIIANFFDEEEVPGSNTAECTSVESSDSNCSLTIKGYMSLFARESEEKPYLLDVYYSMITQMTTGHKICVTDQGLLGLVPADTQVSDVIAVLENVRAPVILRKVDDGFVMVGTAYIEGLVSDDALEIRVPNPDTIDIFPLV